MIDRETLNNKYELALTHLRQANAEADRLLKEKKQLEARLAEVDKRIVQLHGTHYSRGGQIDTFKQEVAKAELELQHSVSRPVVWIERSYGSGDYVVSKVTTKRIYVSPFGSTHHELFNLDGTTVSKGGRAKLDIEKTFPEGLANWTGGR